ncbi:vacuolar protein sorting-associated family 26 protein [Calycomorphotria hydatis]|uniref:Arrestin-like N-terminal domain-containing protein n=1 Tax=Calycomorphotria hydatis TaxID=2528027 RepID=A0A517T6C2_9PLAN|nr:hypothetical protein [Calycomorphotria hydatis]QDT63923.1 hypothetical protein V22_11510 [Calycomorphotria hydatis]
MIEVKFESETIDPGQPIRGEVLWYPEKDVTPRKVTVAVGWKTEGRADQTKDMIAHHDENVGSVVQGDEIRIPFSCQIPADVMPSFAGQLIRIVWHVHVRADLPWAWDEKADFEFTVNPAVAEG